jgi:hypothetical protein
MVQNTSELGLRSGVVTALLVTPSKAKTPEAWEKDLDAMWEEAIAGLKQHAGFMGAIALWSTSHPGTCAVLGFWRSMEDRLAYESRSAGVRPIFESLYAVPPERNRFIISRSTFG